jgi:hypothetical protein
MNWMYRGMGEGESRKQVLQESLGGLGGSPHIMVEWKEGSKDRGWALEGVSMTSWMGIVHSLVPSRVCTIGVMGGMESLWHVHPSMMSGHRYV